MLYLSLEHVVFILKFLKDFLNTIKLAYELWFFHFQLLQLL